jgi:subtilase family serine protease
MLILSELCFFLTLFISLFLSFFLFVSYSFIFLSVTVAFIADALGIGSSECEQLGVNSQQYVARVNVEFQKIGLRGTSLISASGDSGANGRTDPDCTESHLNPPYPAASPYITSVGATQIDTGSGTFVYS